MTIHVRKNKKSTTIAFKAETDQEGVDLKNAVVAACPLLGTDCVTNIIENLGGAGYKADSISRVGPNIRVEASR